MLIGLMVNFWKDGVAVLPTVLQPQFTLKFHSLMGVTHGDILLGDVTSEEDAVSDDGVES